MRGISMSIRMRSGRCAIAMLKACAPSEAVRTSYAPRRRRISWSIRTDAESSTTRMVFLEPILTLSRALRRVLGKRAQSPHFLVYEAFGARQRRSIAMYKYRRPDARSAARRDCRTDAQLRGPFRGKPREPDALWRGLRPAGGGSAGTREHAPGERFGRTPVGPPPPGPPQPA